MRVLIFFDLPTETREDRRDYTRFRKFLIKSGYMMIQESVYSKLSLNSGQTDQIIEEVKKHRPQKGSVQILSITEKQYSKMEILSGNVDTDVLNSDERLVII
ncbi:MAG: CRISPR-associated endonuclease Cas2 [Acutalibacteraceae bacterium]